MVDNNLIIQLEKIDEIENESIQKEEADKIINSINAHLITKSSLIMELINDIQNDSIKNYIIDRI